MAENLELLQQIDFHYLDLTELLVPLTSRYLQETRLIVKPQKFLFEKMLHVILYQLQ